jgi:hypothetical protein
MPRLWRIARRHCAAPKQEALRALQDQVEESDRQSGAQQKSERARAGWSAERRLGELLKAQKETVGLNTGAKGIGKSAVPDENRTPTLSDAGIDKKLSMRAQRVAAIIATGQAFIDAKKSLPHGQFERLFANHADPLPEPVTCSPDWARRFMAIARNKALTNGNYGSHLPASIHTLADLSKLPEDKLEVPSNQEFGAWWDAQGFELGYNERAALVQMGANIDAARKCLETTQSRSIQLIAKNEFSRLHSVMKTDDAPIADAQPKPRPPKKPTKIASAAKQVIL